MLILGVLVVLIGEHEWVALGSLKIAHLCLALQIRSFVISFFVHARFINKTRI
jgi:hypothetical protein